MKTAVKLRKANGHVVLDINRIEAIDTYVGQTDKQPHTVVIMESGEKHLVMVKEPDKLIAFVFEPLP